MEISWLGLDVSRKGHVSRVPVCLSGVGRKALSMGPGDGRVPWADTEPRGSPAEPGRVLDL